MVRRLVVHNKLVEAFGDEIPIIFRPSSVHQLSYPCIVYNLIQYPKSVSNDEAYVIGEEYEVKLMSQRPGDDRAVIMAKIPGVTHIRTFISDDIVHDVFRLHHMTS